MKYFNLLSLSAIIFLSACAQENFDSTCLGFSKSHWGEFTSAEKNNKQLCSCVKTELKNENVSDQGIEAIRTAMSDTIVMRNRFESELNKAVNEGKLTQEERRTFDFAVGTCVTGTTTEEEEVDDMLQQFQDMQ